MGRSGDRKRSIKLGWPSGKKKNLLQERNTFYTLPQDIPLRKWQGRESPEDEVES